MIRKVGELAQFAADCARWNGYVPFDRIIDRRNKNAADVVEVEPIEPVESSIDTGLDLFDLYLPKAVELTPELANFYGRQPYRIVLAGEKSSLRTVLLPLARKYSADLYLPSGEFTDTLIYKMADTGKRDGRPMVVLYFSDCDVAGHQMRISVSRKLQAFEALGIGPSRWKLYPVALTPEQVRAEGLPQDPTPETGTSGSNYERRTQKWKRRFRIEPTEIDALAAIRPDRFRELAEEFIGQFYDADLDRRVRAARREWATRASVVIERELAENPDAAAALGTARSALDTLRTALRELRRSDRSLREILSGIELPDATIPEHNVDMVNQPDPLITSAWPFRKQCLRLIKEKITIKR